MLLSQDALFRTWGLGFPVWGLYGFYGVSQSGDPSRPSACRESTKGVGPVGDFTWSILRSFLYL